MIDYFNKTKQKTKQNTSFVETVICICFKLYKRAALLGPVFGPVVSHLQHRGKHKNCHFQERKKEEALWQT